VATSKVQNMNWFNSFITSRVGQKFVMSLTGLFLISFLLVHLVGNLQLLKDDGGLAFNMYANFMVHNPFIKFISIGLYIGILLHAVQGIALKIKNQKSRGNKGYAVNKFVSKSWYSANMALLGTLILFFILIHMGDFWLKYKFGDVYPMVNIDGQELKNLYWGVNQSFSQLWIVVVYSVAMVVLYFHLLHGFWSAFQTLGIDSHKYTPVIKWVTKVFSFLICLGFLIIPIYCYLNS
jgi:succinate dehydrogenase / fumarate reductase cytochrome b subunit